MRKSSIVFIILVFAFTSCRQETNQNTQTEDVSEVAPETTSDNEADPMCAEIQDMVASMQGPKKYRDFHLYQTICNPNRTFGFEYESDDEVKNMEFTIILRDLKHPDHADFTEYVNSGFAAAQVSKVATTRVSKLPYGTKGYVVALNSEESYGGTYDVFIKENYYLHFIMVNNKSVASPDAIENFVAPFLAKMNLTKLK